MTTCSVVGCDKVHHARSWCRSHYQFWRKYGQPRGVRIERGKYTQCSVPECDRPHATKGYCTMHAHRVARYGSPHVVKQVKGLPNRRRFSDSFKITAGCIDCGYSEHPAALQFDHVRGEKLMDVALMVNNFKHSWPDMLLEMVEKCEVRCANCHAVATRTRLSLGRFT